MAKVLFNLPLEEKKSEVRWKWWKFANLILNNKSMYFEALEMEMQHSIVKILIE